jgi:beta-ureidopropionase
MNTTARIATVCLDYHNSTSLEENRAVGMQLLDRALIQKPDLVCLPEAFTGVGTPRERIDQVAESIPGPTTDAVSSRARASRCYIICPIVTQREGKCWNSAVVIDRQGEILGIYDKIHPVTSSSDYTVFEEGTQPGAQTPVFELDFGKIGIQICFDIQFPCGWASLAKQGARVIFWPSAYNGGFPLQAYAWLHHVYVISAVQSQKARFINPCGEVVSETDSLMNIIFRDINLDFGVCHYDFNYNIPEWIQERYPGKVNLRTYADAGHLLIEPIDKEISLAQLQEEFGFETVSTYTQYHESAFTRLRAGLAALPQKARHLDRPMYTKIGSPGSLK